MIEYIQSLEKKTNSKRTLYVKQMLMNMNVAFTSQPFRQRILKGENIVVEEFCGDFNNQLLLTAHTNKYFSSPGANDDGSGVAVLLEIIKYLKQSHKKKGVKIVFFDLEDGLAYIDGSSYFADHTDISKISFVLNLDGVGMGDSVTISPKIPGATSNDYINFLLQYVKKSGIQYFSFNLPPLLIEDHIPFTKKSLPAISLNLMPKQDVSYLKGITNKSFLHQLKDLLLYRGFNRKNHPMTVMRHRHNELDTSDHVQEESLQLAFQVAMKMIDFHARKAVVA